jgi:hypothetical protein
MTDEAEALLAGVTDMSTVMAEIAGDAAKEGRQQAASNPEWPPLPPATIARKRRRGGSLVIGVGVHGGFAPTIRPFYGRMNAGWKSRAPHAHLFEGGTQAWQRNGMSTFRWGANKKHRPRAQSEGRDGSKWTGSQRQPGRPFAYMTDSAHERYNELVMSYLIRIHERRAA